MKVPVPLVANARVTAPTKLPAALNHLIARLPREDRRHLLAHCVQVELVLSQVLAKPNEDVGYVYFPVNSFISLLTDVSGEVGLEVGMVGREGMLGSHLLLGVEAASLHAVVHGPGSAWRLDAATFVLELQRSAYLRHEVGLYIYVLMERLTLAANVDAEDPAARLDAFGRELVREQWQANPVVEAAARELHEAVDPLLKSLAETRRELRDVPLPETPVRPSLGRPLATVETNLSISSESTWPARICAGSRIEVAVAIGRHSASARSDRAHPLIRAALVF